MAGADDALVGIEYFAGWWRDLPNKWHTGGQDWRPAWPGRVPLLGEYNDQAVMDAEIDAAADHGVDFFQLLWYPQTPGAQREPHAANLNAGVRCFTASPRAHRLRFCLEPVNHPPFELADEAEWERCCRAWAAILEHPSYLRVNGRPVLKIHGFHQFWVDAGRDVAVMQRRIEVLRRSVWERGLPDPLLGVGAGARGIPPAELLAPFDYLATYMDVPDLPARDDPYPYADLLALAQNAWRDYPAHAALPYLPYLPAGWDPRPWRDRRPSFSAPTPAQWRAALTALRDALTASPRLGLPSGERCQPAFTIYAWNEYGEGGIVAPTAGEGWMKLEGLRDVFGAPAR